jgi:hypothetical protein
MSMSSDVNQRRNHSRCRSRKDLLREKLLLLLLSLILPLTLTSNLLSTAVLAQASDEYQVKAAFLYNFVRFVEWPADAFSDSSAPVVIGVVGDDPFGSKIDQMINGKTANGRPLVLKRFTNIKALTFCHILFICSSEKNNLRQALAAAGAGVLTVGETERFTQMGGIINFTIVDSKVRFAINQVAAERAGLKISAKLLNLSRPARN